MFRILLHPHSLPRTGPLGGARVLLPTGWNWWRARLLQPLSHEYGLYHVVYDHPTDIRESSLLFSTETNGEIIDPPAFHLTMLGPEYQDIHNGGMPIATLMTRGPTGVIDVVHNRQPGLGWDMLPGNTCCPGDYSIEEVSREHRRVQYGRERRWDDSTRREYDSSMGYLRWPPYDEVHDWAGNLIGILTPNEIRQREDLPPRVSESHPNAILRGLRDYQRERMHRPTAVVMHPADYRRLLMQIQAHQGPPVFNPTEQFGTVFGLQIQLSHHLSEGQMMVVGEEAAQAVIVGLNRDLRAAQDEAVRQARQPRSSNILPEQEVIDEIDRLVNDQLRPGPVDDYQVNRYDKCGECGHDWHGLDCEACGCLNTDWLQDGKQR